MKLFLMILLGIDMIAVVAVMLVGAVGMANVSRDPRTSNKLMRARVALQGVAVGLVVLLLLTGR
jgi:succinate dehydrogenase hydrophobic anchor subunit